MLGDLVVAQLKTLIASFLIKTRPSIHREGVSDCLEDRSDRVRKARDTVEVSEMSGVILVG